MNTQINFLLFYIPRILLGRGLKDATLGIMSSFA